MSKKILLLEDEEILGRIYSRSLREAGFTVTWCRSAKTAIEVIDKSIADGIVLDHGIREEGQSGMALIPILKKKSPNAKIAMLSNYSQFHLGKAALKAGADAYWVKLNTPPSDLVRHLERLLLEEDRKHGTPQGRVPDPDLPPMELDDFFANIKS